MATTGMFNGSLLSLFINDESAQTTTVVNAGTDTFTIVGHGWVDTDKVRVTYLGDCDGITLYGEYFIVNKTTDTFQVSLTSGGAAVAITATVTLFPKFVRLFKTPEKIAYLTSKGLDLSTNMIDVTTDDSSGWAVALAGLKSGKFSAEGIVVWDEASTEQNWDQLWLAYLNGTELIVRLNSHSSGTPVSGDTYYQASVYLDSLSESAPMYDKVTFSASFTVTRALTTGTNA